MEDIVQLILESKLIDAGVNAATLQAIYLGGVLAPIFFLATCVWNFFTTTMENLGTRPKFFDRMDLIRAGVLWFLLTVGYLPVFGTLAYLGDTLGRVSISKSAQVKAGKDKLHGFVENEIKKETTLKEEEAKEDAETSTDAVQKEDSWSMMGLFGSGVNTFMFSLFSAGTLVVSSIIRIVVEAFALMLAKLFYAIGPVVIAFSILPVFKDKINQWFGIYINCLMVPFTCNLLDTIYYNIINQGMKGEVIANPVALSCFNLVFIICYCLVFWVTSFYAGSSGGAKILSTAVGAATTAVSMGGSMLASKMGGGAAGAIGGNIIEDSAGTTNSAK